MFAFYFAILSAITPPVALAVFAAAGLAKSNLWTTGWAAVKIGAAGFIVPFMFVYEPALLMIGPWTSVLPAVASLGTNPTFVDDGRLVLEVHVLDFDADLYGARVRVEFVAWLRAEARFDSVPALLAQIDRDIVDARAALAAG